MEYVLIGFLIYIVFGLVVAIASQKLQDCEWEEVVIITFLWPIFVTLVWRDYRTKHELDKWDAAVDKTVEENKEAWKKLGDS